MSREADWSGLGLDGDPTPGDAARIREVISSQNDLVTLANTIDDGLTEVRDTTGDAFIGKTADALRDVIDGHLRKFVSTFRDAQETVQSALRTYAGVMEEQQGRADGALSQAGGLAEDDEAGRATLRSTAEDAGGVLSSAASTAAKAIRDAARSIASPIDACDEIMKALGWLAIILIIPAIIMGGPVALFAIGLNVAIFIKTAVDFARGDASALDLVLAGLGMIAPSTKGISVANIFKGLRGLTAKGIVAAKSTFTAFKNVFTTRNLISFSTGLFHSLGDFARAAGSWTRGLSGLWTHTPFSSIAGFGGKIFNTVNSAIHVVTSLRPSMVPALVVSGLGHFTFAGHLAIDAFRGLGTASRGIGSGLWNGARWAWNQVSGWKWLRVILPVDAAEVRALGIGKALKVGLVDRGLFGTYRYGAVGVDGKLLGSAGHISTITGAGGPVPPVHVDMANELALIRRGDFAGPGSTPTFNPVAAGTATPPAAHLDVNFSGLGSADWSMKSLRGMDGAIDLPVVHSPELRAGSWTAMPPPASASTITTTPGGLIVNVTPPHVAAMTAPTAAGGDIVNLGSSSAGNLHALAGVGDIGMPGAGARIADVPSVGHVDVTAPLTPAPHVSVVGAADTGRAGVVPSALVHADVPGSGALSGVGKVDVPAAASAVSHVPAARLDPPVPVPHAEGRAPAIRVTGEDGASHAMVPLDGDLPGGFIRVPEDGAAPRLVDGSGVDVPAHAHVTPQSDGGFRVEVDGQHTGYGADGAHTFDAVQLNDPTGKALDEFAHLPVDSQAYHPVGELVTAGGVAVPDTSVIRFPDGTLQVDGGGGLRLGEFKGYRADGSIDSMRINLVDKGTVKPGEHFDINFPAGDAKPTWKRVTTTGVSPTNGPAKWFDSGTVSEKGLANGRIQLLSHSGTEVFERRPLPDGGFLDAQRPTGAATFGRFTHQRTDWIEIRPDGTPGLHGLRHFDESGRSWFDTAVGARVRHWQENPDGGHVLATIDSSGKTTWHRYDADYNHLAQGTREWSTGGGWTDTMINPRTGANEVVHQKFGRFHLPDNNQRYIQFEMDSDGTLKRDWVSLSAQGKENGSGKVLADGSFLAATRRFEQRPPAWVRGFFSATGDHSFDQVPWLKGDSHFQVHTWKQTPAVGGTPTTGIRLVGPDSSTIDIATGGSILRGTGKLANGNTLTVGDVRLPDGATARSGYLPWSEGADNLHGHRTFNPDDLHGTAGAGDRDRLVWQDRFTTDPPDGDWYTPHTTGPDGSPQRWQAIREGFSDGTVIEYRPGSGDWIRYDHEGAIVGRSDAWPTGVDGGHSSTVTATGSAGATRIPWQAGGTARPASGGVRVLASGGGMGRYWDAVSFQDFDQAGKLVRDHRLLSDGTHVDAWRAVDGRGEVSWHWNKVDQHGNVMSFGDGPGDRVRTWIDQAGNKLDDWQAGARWADRVTSLDDRLIQEIPPLRSSGSKVQDWLSDTPVRVREYQATPTAPHNLDNWSEFDNGSVVRTKTTLDDGTFLESDEWNKQWRRYGGPEGHTLLAERTMAGYVWETDTFGRVSLVGRENDFRGWLTEYRGYNRMLGEPNRFQWAGNALGESLYTPFLNKTVPQALVDFAQQFTLDFIMGLTVNAIAAHVSGRDFTWTDVAKAAFGSAVGGAVKIGVTGMHNLAGRGGAAKTGLGNVDGGAPYHRPPASSDNWSANWAGNEEVIRWRSGTYDFGVGMGTGAISGFIVGSATPAIFGVTDGNGNHIYLSGVDALREGGYAAATGLVGGLTLGAGKTLLLNNLGGRLYHRGGFTDVVLVGSVSKFIDKIFGGLVIAPELRAVDPPDWQKPPPKPVPAPTPGNPTQPMR